MSEPNDIFAGDNPFEIIRRWMDEATASELNDPNAMALASVDEDGMPNVRTVLLKEIEDDAFVFYTNYGSAKAKELESAGKAAFVIHWKSLRRQVRARGTISREDGPQADAYFSSRHPESRVSAWASRQSQPLESRERLLEEAEQIKAERGGEPPRPPFWGGYRLTPRVIEIWANGDFRLHDRFKWTRGISSPNWSAQRLYP